MAEGGVMKLLKKLEKELTVNDFIQILKENNVSFDAKLSIMGAEIQYILLDKHHVLLDEINCMEEL